MKIKTKLTLGVGLLFLLIILLSVIGATQINRLASDTENILVANYHTLDYVRMMSNALDNMDADPTARERFEKALKNQKTNLTEVGEPELTQKLDNHYRSLLKQPDDKNLPKLIRSDLDEITKLNMEAIRRKSEIAENTAGNATLWIIVTGAACFLIAFLLLIKLPGNIADPIRELTQRIGEIADKRYDQRVNFEDHSEFGQLAKAFNSMASKLQEYNETNLAKLLFEKKRIDALINNMHDPVIGLDENKKVIFANHRALHILGLRTDDAIGKSAVDISLNNDLMRTLMRDLPNGKNTPQPEERPLKIFADDKESYFEKEVVDIVITPTGESVRQLIGHVIILRNITKLKELDFAKTNFIATVSHELKTPISSIKMSVQLLENENTGPMNAEQKQLIDGIKDDSVRLLNITGELLNLSQVETGNIQLNIQKSSPYLICRYAIDAVRIQAEHKQIVVESHIEKSLPDIKADSEKTAWVLINFLTNAIRYSPEQSKIVVSASRADGYVQFSVTDQGKGIESRYTQKIFDRYFQIPGSNKTGTGLGLAISKEFIEAQGGLIGVKSEIGMGSRFYFELLEA